MIIYSKSSENNPAAIGKLETPIKMIIERESEIQKNTPSVYNTIFNVEKSNRFGETIVNQSEFNVFQSVNEGEGAVLDSVYEISHKFIEHVQFMKEFIITAEMMEDAVYGIAASAKHRAENFARSYYKTLNLLCTKALASATNVNVSFLGTELDLTSPDGVSLFNQFHPWGTDEGDNGVQTNYLWGDIFKKGEGESRAYAPEAFERALSLLSDRMRNMKDESGLPLGYTADTIILPGNRPIAEAIARKVCGSYSVTGSSHNDINVHYGKWKIHVLPYWTTNDDRVIIMSSDANKELCGNMLFNRIPLTVNNWVDNHTGNYVWTGRCRFGIGFGNYKHILLAVDSETSVEDCTSVEF